MSTIEAVDGLLLTCMGQKVSELRREEREGGRKGREGGREE